MQYIIFLKDMYEKIINIGVGMRKKFFYFVLLLILIFSFSLVACGPNRENGDSKPVANAELDEYNQIVNQMKGVFLKNSNQEEAISVMSAKAYNVSTLSLTSKETAISNMFEVMTADSSKKESKDMDYYAYGIDFSTMTARIAGYAANNFFREPSFYGLNILMDYGGNTIINASVTKEGNVIKTYLFTTFKNSQNQTFKEYNYTEINFTSQTNFNILVIDYTYDQQDNISSQALIYASSNKDFFFLSGDVENPKTGIVFFDKGEGNSAYVIEGAKSNTIGNLLDLMSQNFALSNQDKTFIGNLYNTQNHSINFKQVTQAKADLGIIIDMEDEEYVSPIGFVSNKNAEDLIGRKTLQAFVDDGKSIDGTTLTIPSEFNYLSGGIYFDANIDVLVIPSTIKGVVVYDRLWNYSILDDSLCYFEPADNFEEGRYRAWGGTLVSYRSNADGYFEIRNTKPFKKYILLDDNGQPTQETDAFILDELGNLWIKDSMGNKNYLWGFVSEPSKSSDTLHLPSPTFVSKDRYIQVEHYYGVGFLEAMKNVNKLDEYVACFKHMIIDGYVIEQNMPEMGVVAGFALADNYFFVSYEGEGGKIEGCKWDLETLTINNIIDGARIDLTQLFCSESTGQFGQLKTICQTKIDKVILNGDYNSITYINGYFEMPSLTSTPGNDGVANMKPNGGVEISGTYAISEEYELNGRENAKFSFESTIFGKKVMEVNGYEPNLPMYPDVEKLLIKKSVTELFIGNSLFEIGVNSLPSDRKLTIEFENIAGITFESFYVHDLMDVSSTRVEKVKFNVSELYMENIISNLEWNPYASWLNETVNSTKFVVEFAQPIEGEEELLRNFSFDSFGMVQIKENSNLSTIEINDNFLSIIKQILGKELGEIRLDFWRISENSLKIIVDVSKTFLDNNNGQFPEIIGATTIELSSDMKSLGDLTSILDKIIPSDGSKLIFNGTKQELIDCSGTLGIDYIARLLCIQGENYDQIIFSDGEKICGEINNEILTYEDERTKIIATFSEGLVINYSFVDKLNSNVSFTDASGQMYGDDDNNSWGVNISVMYNGAPEFGIYGDREVVVPVYEIRLYYYYGHTQDGNFNYVYGTDDGADVIQFKVYMLPESIKIS